jgi:hypothetical protein
MIATYVTNYKGAIADNAFLGRRLCRPSSALQVFVWVESNQGTLGGLIHSALHRL